MPNDFSDSRPERDNSPTSDAPTGDRPTGDRPASGQPPGPAPRHHRTVLFYGDEAFERIRQARVMVIGLGGVGGHAAVNLARSGVGALHLVDFDVVTESSLNRSSYAEPADIGRPKTAVLAAYLNRVCPDTRVTVTEAFCDDTLLPDLLPPSSTSPAAGAPATSGSPGGTGGSGPVDLVLDAIDSLQAKVSLLAWCHDHDLPVIASMGAAGKRDVGAVRTGDLGATQVCALARQVRKPDSSAVASRAEFPVSGPWRRAMLCGPTRRRSRRPRARPTQALQPLPAPRPPPTTTGVRPWPAR